MKNPSLSAAFSRRFLSHPPPALVSSACCSSEGSGVSPGRCRLFLSVLLLDGKTSATAGVLLANVESRANRRAKISREGMRCYLQPALANSTNDGTEVDLLRETSDGLQPIEIKSSKTWSASLSDGLRKFLTFMPSSIRPTIVYGGKSYPSTNGNVSVTNFLDFV